ncbi:MAG: hypothetical protein IT427_07980 [Pirellulales bacterium]|nr:hypothetical protein [Pirellulales bacterium]
MQFNPLLAILFHAIGALGAASFYIFFLRVRNWAWESYWLVGGAMLWVVWPWLVAAIAVPDLVEILQQIVRQRAFWAAGAMGIGWGIGNLAFGLSIRYLGFAGGYSVSLGLIIALSGLAPAMVKSLWPDLLPSLAGQETLMQTIATTAGKVSLSALPVMLLGVVLCGLAGWQKNRELPNAAKHEAVRDFNFYKGISASLISGIGSVGIGLAMTSTDPIEALALEHNASKEWANSLTMAIVLTSGGLTNIAWCVGLNFRNGTGRDYFNTRCISLPRNYLFCLLAGTVAYSEFFFYGLATPQMGMLSFTNLPVHVALCVALGSMWGILLGEWKGTGRLARCLLVAGIATLLLGSGIMAWGCWLTSATSKSPAAAIQAEVVQYSNTVATDSPRTSIHL